VDYELILGDTVEKMGEMEDESIDLVVTSPPYNVGVKYDKWDDNLDWSRYWEFTRTWLSECARLLKVGGRICVNCPNLGNSPTNGKSNGLYFFLPEMGQSIKDAGMTIRECITWVKSNTENIAELETNFAMNNTAWGSWMSPSSPYCRSLTEFILIAHKQSPRLTTRGETDLTREEFMIYTRNIWLMPTETQIKHPAPFHEELPKRCIKLNSWIGDTVLDPFMGSGTTGVVARKLNRKFKGIELSPVYYAMAADRINKTMANLGKETRRLSPTVSIAPMFA
jgi:site-specific DNA-methyltransferase (adenine-specific)